MLHLWIIVTLTAVALSASAGVLITKRSSDPAARRQALDMRAEREVSSLLAGMLQKGNTLGHPTAP